MPTIVTATELRTILGVSSSLYPDAYLNDIVDASENLVLPMLVTFQSKINKVKLEDNIAYFITATIQEFTEGQSVIITGCGSPFNLDGLLRGDIAARSSYYTTMRNVLAMSPNEIRIKENMNPYEGGDSYENPSAVYNNRTIGLYWYYVRGSKLSQSVCRNWPKIVEYPMRSIIESSRIGLSTSLESLTAINTNANSDGSLSWIPRVRQML